MHYVYVIKGERNRQIYVGSTNDLDRRIAEHNRGSICSTNKYVPLKLVYYEDYLDKTDALNREHKLKHHGSVIGHLKRRLRNSLAK